MKQAMKRLPVDLSAKLRRGRVDRGGQRTGGHHVDGAGETGLRHDLPGRMQQRRKPRTRLFDIAREWRLDPRFHGGDDHSS